MFIFIWSETTHKQKRLHLFAFKLAFVKT